MSCVYAVIGTHSLVSLKVAQRRIQCSRHNSHGGCAYLQCIQSQHVCGPSWELLGLVYLPRLPKVSTANPICSFSVKVFTPAISSCCQNGHRSLTLTFIISNYSFCKMPVSVCVCAAIIPHVYRHDLGHCQSDLGHCQSASTRQKLFQDHFRFTMAEGH